MQFMYVYINMCITCEYITCVYIYIYILYVCTYIYIYIDVYAYIMFNAY